MKKFLIFFIILFTSFFLGFRVSNAQTDQCQTTNDLNVINKCLDDLIAARSASQKATAGVQAQIAGIKARLSQIEADIPVKEKQIADGEKKLNKLLDILNATIKKYYIESQSTCFICELILSSSISDFIKVQAYQQISINHDKQLITNAALLVSELETQKEELQNEKANLAIAKGKLDKVVNEALAYQATLSSQIAALSQKQQQILAQRLASLNIPLYASMAGGCSSDIGKNPGFSNGFGAFTYGVPNRVGLNQYGAFGRAVRDHETYEQILRAYYNFDSIEKRDATINVEGYHGYSLDDYTKRIYEVPNEWGDQGGMEALKAQAIAARSYALAYTNNGSGSICTTQQCQVFQDNVKTGNWERAVDETAGLVMIQGGSPIKAWFSSTHGGYIHSSGDIGWSGTSWTKNAQDTNGSVNSFADLNNNAYDKDSPWFYCDWGSVHNGTAWLTNDEFSDIANVLLLVQAVGGDQEITKHLYQTDKPNPAGTDTWDSGKVKQELQNRGITPFTSVSSVSVSADFGSGRTTTVSISGNRTGSFAGSDFKNYFNLRAPAKVQIVGPLFNIEPVR